jgi:hypothetical protein
MLTGKVPFQDFSSSQLIEYVARLNWRLPLPEKSKPLGKFSTHCWNKDPAEAPAFAEIAREFRQGEVELEPCEKIDWQNLNENYCLPLNMPLSRRAINVRLRRFACFRWNSTGDAMKQTHCKFAWKTANSWRKSAAMDKNHPLLLLTFYQSEL